MSEALAGIATAPFAFRDQPLRKAVENRVGDSMVSEQRGTIAATETGTKSVSTNTEFRPEPEAAAAIAPNDAAHAGASESKILEMLSGHVLGPASIPSQQSMGVPGFDLQGSIPPSRHFFAGGPIDPKPRADLYEEIGWLARRIQVLEGPPGLPPSEALDRLLDRVTGRKSGEIEIEFALNELKKHCRASGVHCLETGEPAKAEAFEALAVRFEGLHAKYLRQTVSTVVFENHRNASDPRFSQQHKAEFKELLAEGVELHALNMSDSSLDFGP